MEAVFLWIILKFTSEQNLHSSEDKSIPSNLLHFITYNNKNVQPSTKKSHLN
jgi:hypothetical protein